MGRATAVRFRQGEPLIRLIAQRQSARLISERSGVRSPVGLLVPGKTQNCSPGEGTSKLAQRKRAWLITRRSEDRNLSPLLFGSGLQKILTTVGLEPTIFGSEDRRLIH